MAYAKRILLLVPFAIAGALNALMIVADRFQLNRKLIAGYCFLFGSPWAWLLDHNWFGSGHRSWLNDVISYAVILWIPALLYSCCFWLLFFGLNYRSKRQLPLS